MSGRAIFNRATGRAMWSAGSASPGRALYNGLPEFPPVVWWKHNAYTWYALVPAVPGDWTHYSGVYELGQTSGYYIVLFLDLTRTETGWSFTANCPNGGWSYTRTIANGNGPWKMLGYYTPTDSPARRLVSSVLLLYVTPYTGFLPNGGTVTFTLRLTAAGLKRIRVDGIAYPAGFTGATWSGRLAPGEWHEEVVTATMPPYPPEVRYGGDIVVAASTDRFRVAVGVRNWQETPE